MVELKKIFQQTSWQMLGKVVTSLSTFIILGLVARTYGKAGTGVFTLTLTYLAIFYLLADFGFNAHALRKSTASGVSGMIEWRKLLGTRLVWSGGLVIIAVATLPFWPFAMAEFSRAVLFGCLAIMASAVFVTCNLIFQSKLRYELSVLSLSLGTLIGLAILVYLVSLRVPVSTLLAGHLLGWTVISTVALLTVVRFTKTALPIFDKGYMVSLLKDSWPIAATLTLNVVYFRADAFMISYFKGISDVGIYNVAYSVFQSALVFPAFIMNSYYPLMLRSLEGIKKVGLGLLGLALLGVVFTMMAAPLIIKILTGGGFEGSVISLQILSFGFPAYFLSSLLMWLLITKGQYKRMLVIYAVGLLVNLILNFIYIPQFSFLAASWTTIVSEYLIVVLQVFALYWVR